MEPSSGGIRVGVMTRLLHSVFLEMAFHMLDSHAFNAHEVHHALQRWRSQAPHRCRAPSQTLTGRAGVPHLWGSLVQTTQLVDANNKKIVQLGSPPQSRSGFVTCGCREQERTLNSTQLNSTQLAHSQLNSNQLH